MILETILQFTLDINQLNDILHLHNTPLKSDDILIRIYEMDQKSIEVSQFGNVKHKSLSHEFKRYCKCLKLMDDNSLMEEYVNVHALGKAWPEITNGMKQVGIVDMELYLYGNVAFMIMDCVKDFEHDEAMKVLGGLDRQTEWERYVSRFQNVKEGESDTASGKWNVMELEFVLNRYLVVECSVCEKRVEFDKGVIVPMMNLERQCYARYCVDCIPNVHFTITNLGIKILNK